MIDREIHLAKALLVESNALLRSVTGGQLRDLGVGHVTNASRVKDARLLLERERFDIVVCNREFEGSDYSGQDLVDELRRENLLPHSTVFLMVVQTAPYHHVIEAAEVRLLFLEALDGLDQRYSKPPRVERTQHVAQFALATAGFEQPRVQFGPAEPAVGIIRRGQARIAALGEQAMELSLAGKAAEAALLLLEEGDRSGNAKLLEMAGQIARRHRASLDQPELADTLAARAAAALNHCSASNHIAGIQRGGRSPGGLQLRGAAAAQPVTTVTANAA